MFQRSLAANNRGHDRKLQAQKASGKRFNFFSERVINIWNKLSQEAVSSPNINIFKSHLSKELQIQCSKYNYCF